jgi:hypothetical protein
VLFRMQNWRNYFDLENHRMKFLNEQQIIAVLNLKF